MEAQILKMSLKSPHLFRIGDLNAYFVNSWPSLACGLESWSQILFLIEQVDNNDF